MVSRIIPRIPPPEAEQSKSQGNEHIEGGAPAPVDCDHGHQRLGRGGAQGQSGTGYGIGQCPVTDRKPALYGRRLHRVHGRVGGPQYKAHQHQNRHDTGAGLDQRARQQAGQGRSCHAQQPDGHQSAPGTKAGTGDTAWQLEQGVAPDKAGEDPTHLKLAQGQLGHHELTRHVDVLAHQVGQEAEHEQDGEESPAHG